MSADSFELDLRNKMKSHASELDSSMRPAPALHVLLSSGASTGRPFPRLALGFGLALGAAAVLALAIFSASLPPQQPPVGSPLASVSPSPSVSLVSPSPSPISPSPSRASPASPRSFASPSASIALVFEGSSAA
jgi:hypothetical protein